MENSIKLHKLRACIEIVKYSLSPEEAEDYSLVQKKARGYFINLSNKEIGKLFCEKLDYKEFVTEPIKNDPLACTFIFYKH